MRDKSGLKVRDLGAPFDVLWLRLPVLPGDPADLVGKVRGGQMFVMIYRGDYWQCAYLIPKGGFDAIKAEGLTKFRARLKQIAGFAAGRVDEAITDFDQVKLLTVTVDRLEKWATAGPGLHRRCGPCHVAHRRRRHQSRHPGRGGDGQYPGPGAAAARARAFAIWKRSRRGGNFPPG